MRRKGRVALLSAGVVAAAVASAVLVLRTPWAGARLCQLAEARARTAAGLPIALRACRIDPFRLEVRARDVRVGDPASPLFAADRVRARLAPVQALGGRVLLSELEIDRPRVAAELPPARGRAAAACPPPALARFEVERLALREGSVELGLPGGERLVVGRLDVTAQPPPRGRGVAALRGPGPVRTAVDVELRAARLDAHGRSVAVDAAKLEGVLALDLSRLEVRSATLDLPGAHLAASGHLDALCRPRLDLAVSAEGELPALLAVAGAAGRESTGRVEAKLAVSGTLDAPIIAGEVRLAAASVEGWRAGDAVAEVKLAGGDLRVERLEVPTQGGRVVARGLVRLGREVGLEAEAALERVELAEILARLHLPGAWVMMRVGGRVRVSGTASPLRLAGDAALDFTDFRVLGHDWDSWREGEPAILDLRRGRVDAAVHIDPAGVRVAQARARVGGAALDARAMLHFDPRKGFEIRCSGGVDLDELRHLASVPVGGAGEVEDVLVRAAPYGNPHVEGRARVRGFRFLELDLGEAAGLLAYDDFALRATGVVGHRGATRYEGEVAVDLARTPVEVTSARYAAQGRLRDLFEAAMPWKPAARALRDAVDAEVTLRGTARGPAPALEAALDGELGAGAVARRPFDGGRFEARVEGGKRLVFQRAALSRYGGALEATGTLGFEPPFPWDVESRFTGVSVADLDLPGGRWTGTAAGAAALWGSWERPRARLTARGDGVAVDGIPLEGAQVAVRLQGEEVGYSASSRGVELTGTAHTGGRMPFSLEAHLDLDDVARLARGGSPSALRVSARGVARARGALLDPDRVEGRLELSELSGGVADFKVSNDSPAVLTLEAGRIVLSPLVLRGLNTSLLLAGAREPSGALGVDARGSLDLRLLGGLIPAVTQLRGQLAVEASVTGTVAEPLLVGTGELRDASFGVAGASLLFGAVNGGLAFSQNRVFFDRVEAAVNGGHAQLEGEVELVRLLPARVRVGAEVADVQLRIPEYLPSVVSGQLAAAGTWESMLLSGKLRVASAFYGEPVDLERRVLEVPRRRPAAKPFDRAGEWLRFDVALAVEGDARIENDLVRGAVRGDLTLTGTLASPGLVGTLALAQGSRATFRGNEFLLTHAVVDFTDRRKVQMALDVTGEAVVRDYTVYMHVYGPYADPTLQLTSQPALSQQDIVTLLSLGFTTRDAAAAGAVTGAATAAAAQALFSASGLDDQVRRFAPRSRLLRDFTVRMTTAYSEGAGQVTPRAEFETKALDDRLRLRYQAPISGARGQRAQAEMRLGGNASLQYQWDNDNPQVQSFTQSFGDHGLDLKLRWDWND